jgi:hypothetical protein
MVYAYFFHWVYGPCRSFGLLQGQFSGASALSCFRSWKSAWFIFASYSLTFDWFHGVGVFSSKPQPPNWRSSVFLLFCVVTFDLSGKRNPASSYATAGIALGIIWPLERHQYVEAGIPSVGYDLYRSANMCIYQYCKVHIGVGDYRRKRVVEILMWNALGKRPLGGHEIWSLLRRSVCLGLTFK